MNEKPITLTDFIARYPLWGKWQVSYTNRTHLEPDQWIDLGQIDISYGEEEAQAFPVLPFTFEPATESQLVEAFAKVSNELDGKDAAGIVRDQLAEGALRCGLISPDLELIGHEHITGAWGELCNCRYLILVTDTSALRCGIISLLTATLLETVIWTIVPVFVLIEVQGRADSITAIDRDERSPKFYRILRQQPQVASVIREINNIKAHRPIEFLEAPPELIGRVQGFAPGQLRKGKDTLRESINDRLIIESVKGLKRERGIQQGVYLITGDKNMASLAQVENVDSICVESPKLPASLNSLRYSPFNPDQNRRFVVCPFHHFLWDLTQVFSVIRVRNNQSGRCYELKYYSKYRRDWLHDVLGIREC
jgi:hypothetical protein